MKFDLHLYHHFGDDDLASKIDKLVAVGTTLTQKVDKIMATIDQVVAKMDELTTTVDGIQELIVGLRQQVADALSGVTLPPGVQAKLDDVFAKAESNTQELNDALLANTPSEPA